MFILTFCDLFLRLDTQCWSHMILVWHHTLVHRRSASSSDLNVLIPALVVDDLSVKATEFSSFFSFLKKKSHSFGFLNRF